MAKRERQWIVMTRRVDLRTLVALALLIVSSVAIVAVFRLAMASATEGRWVLPLDDAYIHQQYARQAARGLFMRYNDQDLPSSGATSLLYPLILALFYRLGAHGDALSTVAFLLGAASLSVSAWLAGRLAQRLAGEGSAWWVPGVGAGLYLCNGALLFGHLSGMESGLLLVCLLAYLLATFEDRHREMCWWGACLALVRPEGLVVVLLVGSWFFVRRRAHGSLHALLPVIVPVAFGLIQPIINLLLTGSATANGLRVKGWISAGTSILDASADIVRTFARLIWTTLVGIRYEDAYAALESRFDDPMLYLPLLLGLCGCVWLSWRVAGELRSSEGTEPWPGPGTLILSLIVALLGANALMMTAEWHLYRYALPAYALILPSASAWLGTLRGKTYLGPGVAVVWILLSMVSIPGFLSSYGSSAATVLNQQVALGEWIRDNLPQTARVAVHDAGAIRYYGERATYDMLGLTSPAEVSLAWREGSGAMYEVMWRSAARPSHFATYPEVAHFPYLSSAGVFGTELYRVEYVQPGSVASAGPVQSVYVADWSASMDNDEPMQHDILALVAGLDMVDSINVADLEQESTHDYSQWPALGQACGLTELHRLAGSLPPHVDIADGGRVVTGGERFTLSVNHGEDLVLVGRFRGTEDIVLDVSINGTDVGQLAYWKYEGAWQERALLVPGEVLTGSVADVVIQVHLQPGASREHRPYRWWAYQGSVEVAAPPFVVNATTTEGQRLIGYDLDLPTGASGESAAKLHLFWIGDRASARDLVRYVHWVGANGVMLAQLDSRPGDGTRPTWSWQPGFAFTDVVLLTTRTDIVGSALYVGLYDPVTLEAVPLKGADEAGRLLLMVLP